MSFSITIIIVITTALVSIAALSQQRIKDDLIFYPPAIKYGQQYRFITHGFIHADAFHLIFNMIALYSFGETLEDIYKIDCIFGGMGKLFFLVLYMTALVVASIPDYIKYKDVSYFSSLGASGAVSAVVFSTILFLPK